MLSKKKYATLFLIAGLTTVFAQRSLKPYSGDSQKNEVNASLLGASVDFRYLDVLDLTKPSLPSKSEQYLFKVYRDERKPVVFNKKKKVKPLGVQYTWIDTQSPIAHHFVVTDYDLEQQVLSKRIANMGIDSVFSARSTRAYDKYKRWVGANYPMHAYTNKYIEKYALTLQVEDATVLNTIPDEFKEDVRALGRDITAEGFLYRHGTHFVGKVTYGGNYLMRNAIQKETYVNSAYDEQGFKTALKQQLLAHNNGIDTKINIGNPATFTVGGTKSIKDPNRWSASVDLNPTPVSISLRRVSSLLNRRLFAGDTLIEAKKYLLDSVVGNMELAAKKMLSTEKKHGYFQKENLLFRQRVTTVEKVISGKSEDKDGDYTGFMVMGFHGSDDAILAMQPLFDHGDINTATLITDEVINVDKLIDVEISPEDLEKGYVSVWDDAKKLTRSKDRTRLRYSGTKDAQIKLKDAIGKRISNDIMITTIDEDVYKVSYSIEQLQERDLIDNTSYRFGDVMDSQLLTAAAKGNIQKLRNLLESGGNKHARGLIKAAIEAHQSVKVVNAITDMGVKPSNEDLDVVFVPDHFNPAIALSLLERGAKPKNNMIFKAVAYSSPQVVYALLREGARPTNNDLTYAVKGKRYAIVKALMNEVDFKNFVAGTPELRLAIENEDAEMARRFVNLGARADAETFSKAAENKERELLEVVIPVTDPDNDVMEHVALMDDTQLFEKFVDRGAVLTDNRAVAAAIDNNNVEILRLALENNADATEALEYAVEKENKEAIEVSLKNEARPEAAFVYAAKNNDLTLFEETLVTYKGNPNKALAEAVKQDQLRLARSAIGLGKDLNTSDQLTMAVENINLDMVKLLVENKADPNLAMVEAVEAESVPITEYLLDKGATVANPEIIKKAVDTDNVEMTKVLIEKGKADPNDAVLVATEKSNPEMMKTLLKYKANPQLGIKRAIQKADTEIALMLIESGASTRGLMRDAAASGNVAIVKKMIEKGEDPNQGLSVALKKNHIEVVKALIEGGVDVSSTTYLFNAIREDQPQVAKTLYESGADVNYIFSDQGNYLHFICEQANKTNMISTFLTFGLDVNRQDNDGNTPLHLAVRMGDVNLGMVKALITADADVNIVNNDGKTPLKLAKGKAIKDLLMAQGAVR